MIVGPPGGREGGRRRPHNILGMDVPPTFGRVYDTTRKKKEGEKKRGGESGTADRLSIGPPYQNNSFDVRRRGKKEGPGNLCPGQTKLTTNWARRRRGGGEKGGNFPPHSPHFKIVGEKGEGKERSFIQAFSLFLVPPRKVEKGEIFNLSGRGFLYDDSREKKRKARLCFLLLAPIEGGGGGKAASFSWKGEEKVPMIFTDVTCPSISL